MINPPIRPATTLRRIHDNLDKPDTLHPPRQIRTKILVIKKHDLKIAQHPALQNTPYAIFGKTAINRIFSPLANKNFPTSWERILERILILPKIVPGGRITAQQILMMLCQPPSLPKLPPNTPISPTKTAKLMGWSLKYYNKLAFCNDPPSNEILQTAKFRNQSHHTSTQLEKLQFGIIEKPQIPKNPDTIELSTANRKGPFPCLPPNLQRQLKP